jgi:NADH:ubiquinone oxidoreductase subunit 2 (subunit N)
MVVERAVDRTCVLGVLSALMQHDLKRLSAYHTVENIGIIFLGLGLALAFSSHGLPAPAALALTVPYSTFSITACSRPCCSLALARCSPPRASAIWSTSAA